MRPCVEHGDLGSLRLNSDAVIASTPFAVCVYCGASEGLNPAMPEAAQRVGRLLGERRWRLVYGGGRSGLMGALADAALAAGAHVVGVIPQSLMAREVGHPGLSELHVVQTMHQRKQMMAERSDAFLALPGGIGTLEELFETWTWRQLGYHAKPLGLLNVAGYYDALLQFVRGACTSGFLSRDQLDLLVVDDDAERLLHTLNRLAANPRPAPESSDYSRT